MRQQTQKKPGQPLVVNISRDRYEVFVSVQCITIINTGNDTPATEKNLQWQEVHPQKKRLLSLSHHRESRVGGRKNLQNPDEVQSRIKTQTGLRTPGKMSHWHSRVTHRRGMPSRRGHIACISVSAIIPAELWGPKEREPWGKARQPATAGTDSSHFMAGHFSPS